jgi:SH3-like domain-containing protein
MAMKILKIVYRSGLEFFLLIFALNCFADHVKDPKKEINRFVTIKSEQVNTRVGPGLQYPVDVIFVNKAEPVEIIAEFNNWRQIKDFDGLVSWVHSSLLSRKRSVIINSTQPVYLFGKPDHNSKVKAHVSGKVRCEFLNYCNPEWCKVKCKNVKGWMLRKYLWGINKKEFQENKEFLLYIKSIF